MLFSIYIISILVSNKGYKINLLSQIFFYIKNNKVSYYLILLTAFRIEIHFINDMKFWKMAKEVGATMKRNALYSMSGG